ncbi:UNVERIFIED_CONTAM: hypothetical protein Sindi_1876200 [Sesamum indicum]
MRKKSKACEEDTCQVEEQTEEVEEDVSVSLNVMCESISSGTLRVKGQINGKDIHIFIDSGSTHSFIDEKVIKALNLKTEDTTPMMVSIADGYRLMSKIFCPELQWEIQGSQFSYLARALKLGGCED